MSEQKRRVNRHVRVRNVIITVTALFGISSLFLIYNIWLLKGIEDFIRYAIMAFLGIILITFIISAIKTMKKGKLKRLIVFILMAFIIGSLQIVASYYISKAYTSINKMNKSEATYETDLIVMNDSKIKKISDLNNKKIGIIKDTNSIEGYIISDEIIKENDIDRDTLVLQDDFLSLVNALYDGEVDAIFISGSYVSMFSAIDQFANIKADTRIITSKTKTTKKQEATGSNTGSKITKPFTMLIMGIDSTDENIESSTSFNGDSLILVTFNPKTLNATMLSIPRDTFVPIMCFKNHIQNKITHAAWYGESCMISTIENFTGIDINYYMKINFKGVVKLVDAVGGVEVDVPYNFCEQNSNREWGKNTVYVEKGLQTLNGEEALAFARNRHPNPSMCSKKWTNYDSNDFVRAQNQQTVIKALINKLKTIRDINKVYEILDLIEKSMDTNLTTNQILSFYDIGKNILEHSQVEGDVLNFQRLNLKTYGAYIYDEGMKLELSDQIYYKGSLDDIVKAMKINLGLVEPTVTKDFTFSINETYEEPVVGKGTYNEASIALVPNFASYTQSSATSWGTKNGVNITFKTVTSSESKYVDGQIINQSVPKNSLVSIAKTKGITLTIVDKTEAPAVNTKVDCTDKDNKTNSACKILNFEGKNISTVNSWASKISSTFTVNKISTDENDNLECKDNNNMVIDQTKNTADKYIYDLDIHTITITYCLNDED